MKKIKDLQAWIVGYEEIDKIVNELRIAWDFLKEGLVEESEIDALYAEAITKIENLELRNMLRREEDKLGVVLKINSGAGGTESRTGPRCSCECISAGARTTATRLRSPTFSKVTRPASSHAPSTLRATSPTAISRARTVSTDPVRVSPYNARGKRMTSFASVFVTPACRRHHRSQG